MTCQGDWRDDTGDSSIIGEKTKQVGELTVAFILLKVVLKYVVGINSV